MINDDYLLDFIGSKENHAWIGGLPPFNMEIVDLEACTNFRVSPSLHQKFKTVWLYEKMLNSYHILSWKIIIDESLRLLGENGFLVIRMQETQEISVPLVKSFLGRNITISVDIEKEIVSNNVYIMIFAITRKNIEAYKSNLWTFSILTMGNKDNNVLKFLESIRKIDRENKHEIIVCGPQKEAYNKYNVKYIDVSVFRDNEYAEISKKKNAIAKMAANPNLLIAHDRYYLSGDFFEDFEKYGYDFDFLSIRQFFISGKEFPSCLFLYEPELCNNYNIVNKNDKFLVKNQYIPGGLMIFKTHILKKIQFNPLLFWDQMEDYELSNILIKNSIVPRINFIGSINVIEFDAKRQKAVDAFDVLEGEKIKHIVKHRYHTPAVYGLSKPRQLKDDNKTKKPAKWMVKKLLGFLQCIDDHGMKYTVKLFMVKICNRLPLLKNRSKNISITLNHIERERAEYKEPAVSFHEIYSINNYKNPLVCTSQLCNQDFLSLPLYQYWTNMIKEKPTPHRKQWEYVYIAQTLYENGCLDQDKRGLGFAVGQEPLPALFALMGCKITASDLDISNLEAQAWARHGQNTQNDVGLLNQKNICPPEIFKRSVSFEAVNMNIIPEHLYDVFDFNWSVCAIEHIGGLEKTLQFLQICLKTLKPGGLAVHTSEFNCSSNNETSLRPDCVILRRQDIQNIARILTEQGHYVYPLDFRQGEGIYDGYTDPPPYKQNIHLRLLLEGYITTSFGIIIKKGGEMQK